MKNRYASSHSVTTGKVKDHRHKSKNDADCHGHKHFAFAREDSISCYSESQYSDEFNKFFQPSVDKEFMSFNEDGQANEIESKADNQSEQLWSKISQLITGSEHDDK